MGDGDTHPYWDRRGPLKRLNRSTDRRTFEGTCEKNVQRKSGGATGGTKVK